MNVVRLYDTTLRDGLQGQGLNLSLAEKLETVKLLDSLGLDYIEAGFLGSNPKDKELFESLETIDTKSRIAAFGMTRKKDISPDDDKNLEALVSSWVPTVTIVGKTWGLHIDKVLETSRAENLRMISESIEYLKEAGKEVIYDAEHFFDAWTDDADYALECLLSARSAGADWITLCDTNGASLPETVREVLLSLNIPELRGVLGIHAHNDMELAVANSLAAVSGGAKLIQGTINGYGERTGNANLVSIAPTLQEKLAYEVNINLESLTQAAHRIDELLNQPSNPNQPYVGSHAFAHKGGMHASGILKDSKTFEHIDPDIVGNRRHIAPSELSGKATVESFAREAGINLNEPELVKAVGLLKTQESRGFSYESAEASFELLLRRELRFFQGYWNLEDFKVLTQKHSNTYIDTEATLKLTLPSGERTIQVAEGNGPVNALDKCLRQALAATYPELENTELVNYRVRIIDADHGTEARTRVLLETKDLNTGETWSTVGVSENIIDASWQALTDGITWFLLKQKAID